MISLGQHGLRGLRQHVILGKGGHRGRHVRIADSTLRGLRVLAGRREIVLREVKPRDIGTDGRRLAQSIIQRLIQYIQRLAGFVAGCHRRLRNTQRIRTHISDENMQVLIGLGARVDNQRVTWNHNVG